MHNIRILGVLLATLLCNSVAAATNEDDWWNPRWRYQTTVEGATPFRHAGKRIIEVAPDFPLLLRNAGITEAFDPNSLRVVEQLADGTLRQVPFAQRTEFDARNSRDRMYLAWFAQSRPGRLGRFDIYFDTTGRGITPALYPGEPLPVANLLANPSFEDVREGLPDSWTVSPRQLVKAGQFAHTTGDRSLMVVADEGTPKDADRNVTISQRIDVVDFAGQEMVFQCDMLAQKAAYGVPVSIELEQYRADGSRILEYAVQPRWLTLELAEGQLVQFCQRGRMSHEVASVNVRIRLRCYVRDADTREYLTGPESFFTVWLDRVVIRPGERWSWPAKTHAGFSGGALQQAPLNRGFEFTGQRRVAFNGASEGALTAGKYNPNPQSVHWGLERGTLELWCRPGWNSDDGREHVFFEGIAYGHRLQSRLSKLGARDGNRLEFTIADAGRTRRTIRSRAELTAGQWFHVAATWDFAKAHLQLFVDGEQIASDGPHGDAWPSSRVPEGKDTRAGIGIMERDRRSMPMQAFIGGDRSCSAETSADAVLDEFRISSSVRYTGSFAPPRAEFPMDEHTRALFHFENEVDGVHDSDDRFLDGYLACELPLVHNTATLAIHDAGQIARRSVAIRPRASTALFESNRAEHRLTVTRPFDKLPDPRFVEFRPREVQRIVTDTAEEFTLEVAGDHEPQMCSITFQHADDRSSTTTLLPRWRANDNIVPFSVQDLAATLAEHAESPVEKSFEVFNYALATSNYYDASICETLGNRHRPRVSYTLTQALNMYAFDQCGPLNYTLRKLLLAAGVSSNDTSGTHHQFQQAFYGGDLRLFDLSPRMYWLERDNRTVVGRRDFEEDLFLKLRQGSSVTSALPGRVSRARFGTAERPHNMDFRLRPGERVNFCWHNEGQWIEVTEDRRPIPLAKVPPYFGNGSIVYQPKVEGPAATLENLSIEENEENASALRVRDRTQSASLTYHASSPYVFSSATLSGRFQTRRAGSVRVSLSFDEGKNWHEVWHNEQTAGLLSVSLRDEVMGRYAYEAKLELDPGAQAEISGLQLRSTFVVSPLSLPGKLALGNNRIRFVGGPVAAPVKTTCRWIERHETDQSVSLNSVRYYMNGAESLRNLFVSPPGDPLRIAVAVSGKPTQFDVWLEGLPEAWITTPGGSNVVTIGSDRVDTAEFVLQPVGSKQGRLLVFEVAVRDGECVRRATAQVLFAHSPLVSEAEHFHQADGAAAPTESPELSGAQGVQFSGNGHLSFKTGAKQNGNHALWLRARWEPESDTHLTLAVDGGTPRPLTATAMIGFTDWTNPNRAHTKMFAHFGEQFGHWSWYRIPDVRLSAGNHVLTIGAAEGACFDALMVLPQNPSVDRAAMNLLQNWNYAPWNNPH